ncbi:hypothetical protein GCM10010937_24290 [Gluconobacter japonicus]|uniref:Uncharacterized protein n=1 Tax=Gluconobacter japonicus TaxID=376620 RepID=A0ABQ5WLK0_GLUJA|nr:hypothetical protein GCM10010937_24290 [Gluconobacter japonicus]
MTVKTAHGARARTGIAIGAGVLLESEERLWLMMGSARKMCVLR